MRRRSFRKQTLNVSLFPFLAVLVCTMGALIVLLVMVVQKARVDAELSAAQQSEVERREGDERESLQQAYEIHEWRRESLVSQRAELQQMVGDNRLKLSHLEDHIRRLEERWRATQAQAHDLEQLGDAAKRGAVAVADELAAARAEVEAARRALQDAQTKAAGRKQTFAIVPYEGPNGTRRRPVYIECTDEGIVLQPERVVLRAADFEGSLGPGNPLDAALRTTREYLARRGGNPVHGEPYPLLIVRPSGTVAYAVARAAIKSWEDEFGYELVDADMQLEFPQPDPALQQALERAIADARQRQALLARAMPGRFGRSSVAGLVATSGGLAAYGMPPGGAAGGSSPTLGGGGSFSNVFRQSQESSSLPSLPNRPFQPAAPGGTGRWSAANSGGSSSFTAEPSAGGSGDGSRGSAGETSGSPAAGSASGGDTSGTLDSPSFGGGTSGNSVNPVMGGNSTIRAANLSGAASSTRPLAASRGENWGLPNQTRSATGFTRYIGIQCLADRLVILPEPGDHRAPTVLAAPVSLASSIDPLVSAVWKRMDSWGIAAENGYWKPVLAVDVGPGAEGRFEELRTLLDHSGLVVERKPSPAKLPARQLPGEQPSGRWGWR